MGEKNLWSKLGLIVLLVGMSLWQIFPLNERLKAGIDLAGGSSLLFEIDDAGLDGSAKQGLAERVAAILKERVDPQGNRNLVWRPIGQNRLEIQMPRPPEKFKQYRDAFEEARNKLAATNITESDVRAALVKPPAERQAVFDEMSKVVKSRKAVFEKLIAADQKNAELKQAATTRPAEGELAQLMDRALMDRNHQVEAVLKTNLDPRILQDLLDLGPKSEIRKERLGKLKDEHPDLTGLIDQMKDSHDNWAGKKGALDDTSDLMRLLRGAGVLEFRILARRNAQNPEMIDSSKPEYNEPSSKYIDQLKQYGPRPRPKDNFRWFKITKSENTKEFNDPPYIVQEYMGTKYVLSHATPDMGLINDKSWTLKSAQPGRDQMGKLNIRFALSSHGKFGDLTGNNVNRPLAIFLDDEAISSANINERINDSGEINGSFTQVYVNYLVNTLEAGALPARLKEVPLQEKTVGPSLGETNRQMGRRAVELSFIATVLFMAVYYCYNGVIADIALLTNLVITLGIMSFLQGTFTLPGIAGLILTLGMAVDANVLIFERMREELQRGVSARMAVKLGYEKAFSAIFDGHVTALVTAVILFWVGSEEIKGFGLTLGIGLALSLFTALFVTRQYYNIMIPTTLNKEETRRAWLGTGLLALLGGAVFALGWVVNKPDNRADSNLIGLGRFLLVMFVTAAVLIVSIWGFRAAYRASGHQKGNRLPMLKLMSSPNFDWMGKYKIYWTISSITICTGLFLMWIGLRHANLLDIEFVGGTSVQIQLKDKFKNLSDEEVLSYITGPRADKGMSAANWLEYAAAQLEKAGVETASGNALYQITTPEKLTGTQLQALLLTRFKEYVSRGGIVTSDKGVTIQIDEARSDAPKDLAAVKSQVQAAANHVRTAANLLQSSRVQSMEETTATGENRKAFEIVTTETNRAVVSEALLAAMGDLLEITQQIEATLVKDADRAPDGIFPIKQDANLLSEVIGGTTQEPIAMFKGGVALVFDQLNPPQPTAAIQQRLREMRLQPEFESISWRNSKIVGLEPAAGAPGAAGQPAFKKVAIVVNDQNLPYYDDAVKWRTEVAEKELKLAQAAFATTQSLQRITQFAPQVASEAAQKAVIAVILSLIAIAGYLWIRFGSAQFGVAGILALYHDVAVALAAVVACHWLYDTPVGHLLGLRDFKIDLNIIAALLTIIGYSINDSIVIFDRIRENRGRMATLSTKLLNDSINQTLSRTILTVFTVFIVVVIMYIFGGEGIKGFAFTMIIGCITGTYSTFAIAVPMVQHQKVMWGTTIVISALTAMGIIDMAVSNKTVTWVLCGIVIAAAVYLFARLRGTGGSTPMPRTLASASA